MDRSFIWILIVAAVLILIVLFMTGLRKQAFTKVYRLLMDREYSEFFREIDSKAMISLFPEWMRENLKLTAYMELQDTKNVTETFNGLMKIKCGNAQKTDLLIRGFQYYLQMQDGKKCKRIKEEMEQIVETKNMEKYCRHYEIVFEHSKEYIAELEQEVREHKNLMRGYLEYLLAKSYQAAGENEAYLKNIRKASAAYKVPVSQLDKKIRVLV